MAQRARKSSRSAQYESAAFREWLERIAANVRRLRELRSWTQEEAVAACDVTRRHYQSVEAATGNVTVTTLARLSTGFGVDPIELVLSAPPIERRRPGRPKR